MGAWLRLRPAMADRWGRDGAVEQPSLLSALAPPPVAPVTPNAERSLMMGGSADDNPGSD